MNHVAIFFFLRKLKNFDPPGSSNKTSSRSGLIGFFSLSMEGKFCGEFSSKEVKFYVGDTKFPLCNYGWGILSG